MKILGIGNAIVDVICKVEDKYLLDKLDQPAWFTVQFQIKTLFDKKFRSDLESLQYLRKKITRFLT